MAVKTTDIKKLLTEEGLTGSPVSAKGKTALHLTDITQTEVPNLKFSIVENYLLITNQEETKGLKLSNYTSLKYIKTDYIKDGKKETYNLTDIISNSLVYNTNPISVNKSKLTTGSTIYNDTINVSGITDLKKSVKVGKNTICR